MLKSEGSRHFVLFLASCMFALFLVELPAFIRVLDYRRIFKPLWGQDLTNIPDPELLHIKRPYTYYKGEARGGQIQLVCHLPASDMTLFRWDVKYDHNGFRNDIDLQRADIVVIGDSVVEGQTVSNAQVMTSVLARLQGKVVANLGQYAYGPREELVVLKRYGLPLRPRTVIWAFSEASDLKDVIHYDKTIAAGQKLRSSWFRFWSDAFDRSFTRNALLRLREIVGPHLRPACITRCGVFQTPDGEKHITYFTYRAQPYTNDDLHALDETTRILADAYKLCAAQGSRLVFVLMPMKFRVFHAACQFPQESECRNWVLTDLPERFQKVVASISPEIGYLDLTPSLVDALKRGAVPAYPDDDHLSPEGHQAAAEGINDYLLSGERR
jgi:hypothetical protein